MSETPDRRDQVKPRARILETAAIPVFTCRVFVQKGSMVQGRVANLAGIQVTASSEREMLQQVIGAFKSAVSGHLEKGEPVPWLDPHAEPVEGEVERLIPVHL